MFFSSRQVNAYRDVHVEIFKLIAGHLSVVVEKSNLYQQVLQEKHTADGLLLNVMPPRIASHLRAGKQAPAENLPEVNILFADIVEFTAFAGRYLPERVLELLQNIFVPLDRLCDVYGVEKIKTIGDEYMAMTGASSGTLHGLAEFALEALRIVEGMRYPDGNPVRMRIGMHTGPAVAGVIGQKKFAYDIWGDAVNIASRMESSAEIGRIHVSEEVRSRLHNEFVFAERGGIEIKGKGLMRTYYLTAKKQSPAPPHR
jgi:class 3 adenylate cyclase